MLYVSALHLFLWLPLVSERVCRLAPLPTVVPLPSSAEACLTSDSMTVEKRMKEDMNLEADSKYFGRELK